LVGMTEIDEIGFHEDDEGEEGKCLALFEPLNGPPKSLG
jgi:hypothetical protein